MSITKRLKKTLSIAVRKLNHLTVTVVTLPYYRFFRQNTLLPILHITQCVQRGDSNAEIAKALSNWRDRKLYEQHFIQLASTILAAAVIGCFSWPPTTHGFWIGPALWYSSLVLSIFAILLSSSQAFIFSALNAPSLGLNSSGDFRRYLALVLVLPHRDSDVAVMQHEEFPFPAERRREVVPRWKMVFTWQAPMMLMAYAVIFFIAGLTVYVCTPLFNGEVGTAGGKISIFYLAITTLIGGIFVYCSFWAYRYIDLEQYSEIMSDDHVLPYPLIASTYSTQLQPL